MEWIVDFGCWLGWGGADLVGLSFCFGFVLLCLALR